MLLFFEIINFLPYLRGEWYIKYHVSDTCYGVIRKRGKKLNASSFSVYNFMRVDAWRQIYLHVL